MYILEDFLSSLQDFLVSRKEYDHNIIRKHTKKLDELGEISFPLCINKWSTLIDNKNVGHAGITTILQYKYPESDKDSLLNILITESSNWKIQIKQIKVKNNDALIFFNKSFDLFRVVMQDVLEHSDTYGFSDIIKNNVIIKISPNIENSEINQLDLTNLRLKLLKDISTNFIMQNTSKSTSNTCNVYLVLNPVEKDKKTILCGPVVNENSVKSTYKASELYKKRSADMRMMAQHKYGIQVKLNPSWENYFDNLGTGSVTIEMLTNKPQKSIKITPNDLQSANKGAAFIFYNCARLSALFKEFDKRVSMREYPELPNCKDIDFSLLKQPEEWELFYVYIIQFPMVIKSCIKDIEKGIINPQHLIYFLSNLSSTFSIYYRRVRILTNPKEHMFSIIHARIYLLKALQCVFHNSLRLLNVDPVREM
ncbi:DALR anticodon-binding domain-containing protein 3 [Diorhabda sublineata]|uniref:DALR anticodon-binding domain-containing protein 3 n=1 Tax=Diorhabda sublineata TaxID=1163346 RepID=UPI0024E13B0F|nr:DALR anticodon-binding domain-containing protein 3 [Diorhabda sublineata]